MKIPRWWMGWAAVSGLWAGAFGVVMAGPPSYDADPFRQLEEVLPTPNIYRAASGAPGHEYWQQRADYDIEVELDDAKQRLRGKLTATYHNRSPLALPYLWFQLDHNRFRPDADGHQSREAPSFGDFSFDELASQMAWEKFDGSFEIGAVRLKGGGELKHTIVKTMMRVDLPEPLKPGAKTEVEVEWEHQINDSDKVWGRGGFERFEKDKNYLYEIAQWHPRLVAYTDVNGWQHKQFLGRGEFTLEFGDYRVAITVPDDHVVAATGELQNPGEVLTDTQRARLKEAEKSAEPVFVVTPEEAEENEKSKPDGTKTWVFRAKEVRDFAWASSRKFIWDAARVEIGGRPVWTMSFYPKEGEPLWSRYSTHSIVHTLEVYSRFTFDYPYPVAISVNGPVYGMEYPMICFNGPRPEEDGTYSAKTKYGLISVIIHEVGHNFFPMIVNSDERQWTWMDEGLNTFLQFIAEQEWEEKYPSRRGKPKDITSYMGSDKQRPIMTNSESILQFGPNAYHKPATALNILRETVLGRELFDFAFREYAQRWAFKRPMPADFFRTMEDASGVDLDWFWRGWFYTTKKVDLAIPAVRLYALDTRDPDLEKPKQRQERDEEEARDVTAERNRRTPRYLDRFPELRDFYNSFDELDVTDADREEFKEFLDELEGDEKALLKTQRLFYVVEIENRGGLVMPVILKITYEDGKNETRRYPAEIFQKDPRRVHKLILARKKIAAMELDPMREIADTNTENNHWPARPIEKSFRLKPEEEEKNPMQKALEAEEKLKKEAAEEKEKEKDGEDGKKPVDKKKGG